ncbi:hypothetical protein IEO21_00850 [Rhodonia placenta]|uniref:RBR-type E3 ubiquitin transferase n=1 Tax=Rhodonia placenta TaxID=104341 RepID=A0A8H7U6U3_9APHY|nr:hypothetical protein IEO21_00850 [Postia placenta]
MAGAVTSTLLRPYLHILSYLGARVLDMESQNGYLTADNERLSGEVSRLEDEVAELKAQARRAKAQSQTQIYVQDKSYRNVSRTLDVVRDSQSQKGKGREVYVPHTSTNEVDSKQFIPPRRQIEGSHASSSRHAGSAFYDPMYDRDFALAAALQAEQMPSQDGAFAASMQREFDGEDARLKAQMTTLKHTAPGIFECGICLEEFNVDVVARIDICGHQFCRTCILGHTAAKIDERRYPIVCPVCMADKGLKKQGDKQYEVFVEMQLAAFSVILHCRKCKNTVFVDKSEHAATEILKIEFGGPKHSCDGSSELKHLMQQRGWKYCPGCKTPAEKIDGCNHMTCMSPGCNTHFCYVCGEAITQSALRSEIKSALSAHYRRCRLFEDVA